MNNAGTSIEEIAAMLGRQPSAIRSRLEKEGLARKNSRPDSG
jgi:hypothetical protein